MFMEQNIWFLQFSCWLLQRNRGALDELLGKRPVHDHQSIGVNEGYGHIQSVQDSLRFACAMVVLLGLELATYGALFLETGEFDIAHTVLVFCH
mmetsp:Transcript_6517/g.15400  ORF Transcript_6517/g.15400 Transcript_6517/m.15400 type:complete len:94 (+) Transcript_6517:180-461(+)